MAGFPRALILPPELAGAMRSHLLAHLPEEACGLAGGVFEAETAQVTTVMPVENILHSPVRFRMDPMGQYQVFSTLEAQGLELVAIFHSHPSGPEGPSATDVAEFAYPGVVTLIWSPVADGDWQVKGFAIDGQDVTSVGMIMG